MPDRLQVWLEGAHVADVERPRRSDARLRLRHTDEALERWPLNTPLVSCSLPVSNRPAAANAFLRGLLPEGDALAVMAARAGISVADTFGLLERYGRDVAGALVIGAEAPDASRFDLEPYSDESLGEEVGALDQNPLGVHDDSELSLAGLQNKLLLVKTDRGWARPRNGYPSTHILKAEDRRFPGIVEAEYRCLSLARRLGLTPVETEFLVAGGIPCLITERYDRIVTERGVRRVHQEDLCQAVGIDGAGNRGRAKYQRRGGGGPGFRQAAQLLEAHAQDAGEELGRLVAALSFTIAVGNADAHAKNISLLHDTEATIRLAPVYDVTSTLLWANLTAESALSVNGHFSLQRLTIADIAAEAASWPYERAAAERIASETVEQLRAVLTTLDSDAQRRLVEARCEALLAGKPAGG
ncbi:MAG: HipA domain-containing protein [Gaiellaceae bacterium]